MMPTTVAPASSHRTWRRGETDHSTWSRVTQSAHNRRPPPPAAWDQVDATLDASFPASDPPSWTLGGYPVVAARSPRRR